MNRWPVNLLVLIVRGCLTQRYSPGARGDIDSNGINLKGDGNAKR